MNQNQTESKPKDAEQPADKGLDETPCSDEPCPCAACANYREYLAWLKREREYIAQRLTSDDLFSAMPPRMREKASFDGLRTLADNLNKMGVRIVRNLREEGAPKQVTISCVHVDSRGSQNASDHPTAS